MHACTTASTPQITCRDWRRTHARTQRALEGRRTTRSAPRYDGVRANSHTPPPHTQQFRATQAFTCHARQQGDTWRQRHLGWPYGCRSALGGGECNGWKNARQPPAHPGADWRGGRRPSAYPLPLLLLTANQGGLHALQQLAGSRIEGGGAEEAGENRVNFVTAVFGEVSRWCGQRATSPCGDTARRLGAGWRSIEMCPTRERVGRGGVQGGEWVRANGAAGVDEWNPPATSPAQPRLRSPGWQTMVAACSCPPATMAASMARRVMVSVCGRGRGAAGQRRHEPLQPSRRDRTEADCFVDRSRSLPLRHSET